MNIVDIGNMETPIYYLKFFLKSLFLAVLKHTDIGNMEMPIYYLKLVLNTLLFGSLEMH